MRRPAIEPRKLDSPGADALVNAEGNTGRGAIASTCSTLHHINPAMLRTAFHAIRRDAAPGVDGETWAHYEKDLDCRIEVLHSNIHMLHRHMLMVVLMRLRQVQPDPYAHQATCDQKLNGERLAQEDDCRDGTEERRRGEVGTCSRCSEITQRQDEQRQADAVTEEADGELARIKAKADLGPLLSIVPHGHGRRLRDLKPRFR